MSRLGPAEPLGELDQAAAFFGAETRRQPVVTEIRKGQGSPEARLLWPARGHVGRARAHRAEQAGSSARGRVRMCPVPAGPEGR